MGLLIVMAFSRVSDEREMKEQISEWEKEIEEKEKGRGEREDKRRGEAGGKRENNQEHQCSSLSSMKTSFIYNIISKVTHTFTVCYWLHRLPMIQHGGKGVLHSSVISGGRNY